MHTDILLFDDCPPCDFAGITDRAHPLDANCIDLGQVGLDREPLGDVSECLTAIEQGVPTPDEECEAGEHEGRHDERGRDQERTGEGSDLGHLECQEDRWDQLSHT